MQISAIEGGIDCLFANLMLIGVIKMKIKVWRLMALAMIWSPGFALAAPVLALSATNGAPGTTVQMPVLLLTDTKVLSAQFDLRFSSKSLTVSAPAAGDAVADHVVASSQVTRDTLRVQINSFTHAELKEGVLVYVPLTIAANARLGKEDLLLTNAFVLNPNGVAIQPLTVVNGSLTIAKPLHFNTNTIGTNDTARSEVRGVASE